MRVPPEAWKLRRNPVALIIPQPELQHFEETAHGFKLNPCRVFFSLADQGFPAGIQSHRKANLCRSSKLTWRPSCCWCLQGWKCRCLVFPRSVRGTPAAASLPGSPRSGWERTELEGLRQGARNQIFLPGLHLPEHTESFPQTHHSIVHF